MTTDATQQDRLGRRNPIVRWGLFFILVFLLLLAFAGIWYVAGEAADPSEEGTLLITIAPGSSGWSVGYQLADSALIESPRRWVWHLRFRGLLKDLQAGTFLVPRSASMSKLATILAEGEEARVMVTIPEGWTSMQIAGKLQETGICDSAGFMTVVFDTSLVDSLGLGSSDARGFLFPESYSLPYNYAPEKTVRVMLEMFINRMGKEWIRAARSSDMGLRDILTLASIVQGEMQLPEEGPEISALYRNRLKTGMKLQADPTVQYSVDGPPRRLYLKDLEVDSPYNTYRYAGLPPSPINNPGRTALESTLNPAPVPWLFMVARGDGGHTFTTTLQDHLQAKKRLDAIRRQVAREQK